MKFQILLALVLVAVALVSAQDPPPPMPPRQCTAECPNRGVYNFPHFRSCTSYYHCIHGFMFVNDCEAGESFNVDTMSCETGTVRCGVDLALQN